MLAWSVLVVCVAVLLAVVAGWAGLVMVVGVGAVVVCWRRCVVGGVVGGGGVVVGWGGGGLWGGVLWVGAREGVVEVDDLVRGSGFGFWAGGASIVDEDGVHVVHVLTCLV